MYEGVLKHSRSIVTKGSHWLYKQPEVLTIDATQIPNFGLTFRYYFEPYETVPVKKIFHVKNKKVTIDKANFCKLQFLFFQACRY